MCSAQVIFQKHPEHYFCTKEEKKNNLVIEGLKFVCRRIGHNFELSTMHLGCFVMYVQDVQFCARFCGSEGLSLGEGRVKRCL